MPAFINDFMPLDLILFRESIFWNGRVVYTTLLFTDNEGVYIPVLVNEFDNCEIDDH
jgi:hypothetical protein